MGGTGSTCSGGAAYSYDARGNLTSTGSRTFSYNLANQLTAAGSTGVAYDPLGRLAQVTASVTTQYLYDGAMLVAEYDGSGTMLRRYVPGRGVDEPLMWYEGADLSSPHWLHTDNQGSVIAATDGAATATPYAYSVTGEPKGGWSSSAPAFRYTGQVAIPSAELYFYKARMYDPALGRFLQTDPTGYQAGMNLYAYVGNDPVNRVDPSGRCYNPEDCATQVEMAVVEATRTWSDTLLSDVGRISAANQLALGAHIKNDQEQQQSLNGANWAPSGKRTACMVGGFAAGTAIGVVAGTIIEPGGGTAALGWAGGELGGALGAAGILGGGILCSDSGNDSGSGTTTHGGERIEQRGISQGDIETAKETAQATGQVTTQVGKYGTPQAIYKGANGVTVVVETAGRNAGKVITAWRN